MQYKTNYCFDKSIKYVQNEHNLQFHEMYYTSLQHKHHSNDVTSLGPSWS